MLTFANRFTSSEAHVWMLVAFANGNFDDVGSSEERAEHSGIQ